MPDRAGLVRTVSRPLAAAPRSPTAWIMAALLAVSLLQRPGRVTFDTKLDLTVDPIAFLGRALHLWNPQASSGELQNQAYGYLFPMGPFFAGCQLLGIPPWVSERLWCGLLLCVAFGGALVLARALRIGSEPARYAGALGYALAPRMLTEIGPVSAELLPAVMLPWVLVPLVRAGRGGSPRRAAGLSALAVLGMGGVNGATVLMSLVLPSLWLLTRRWTRRHVTLVLCWCGSVLAACLWWLLPLLLLGQYSLPFVDYVESASDTTAPMSLFQVLRGTNQWVAYVVQGTPWWPSGFLLVDNPALMVVTGLAAAVGLAGLVLPRLPERRFLVLGALSGLALLTIGYVGALDSPLALGVRHLLDGPLAPLRNVHKFEPGLRLPLALGFAHAVSGRLPLLARGTSLRWATRARLAVGMLLVVAVAAPAWLLTLRPGPGWPDVPDYWRSAMGWLAANDARSRTLLLPGSGFGDYDWGHTVDEPAQALATAPWSVRSQIPLGSEGNTRVMDTVEDVLANGRGSPGLADFLARSGYRFLLLRNDIDRVSTGSPPISLLHAGLAGSPGISLAATFGPDVAPANRPVVDRVDTSAAPSPAIEVYEVHGAVAVATATALSGVPTVSGGPESLLPLLESGMLARDQPAILAGDGGAPTANPLLVTDGLRYRERNVGRVRDNLSQTLAVDEPPRLRRPSLDLLPFRGVEHQTVAVYRGVRAVSASSSVAFADAAGTIDPSGLPYAALDADPSTAWRSSSLTGPAGQWFEVDLDTPKVLLDVTLRFVDDLRVGWPVTRIRITTDAGSVDHDVARGPDPQNFVTRPGLTGKVRVSVLSVAANRHDGNVGIAELTIPGVTAGRALRVPADTVGPPAGLALSRGSSPRYPCVSDANGQRCGPNLARTGEEPVGIDRLFSTTSAANFAVTGTVLPAPGGAPVTVAGRTVSSSTQLGGDPAVGPLAALDGDPTTTWVADPTDLAPALRLAWGTPRTISGIHLSTSDKSGASRPSEVEIRTPARTATVQVNANGEANFAARTDQIEVVVRKTAGSNDDGEGPLRRSAPPGVSELTVVGAEDLLPPLRPDTRFTVACGSGPLLHIDGFSYTTTVSGSLADIAAHRPLTMGTCRDLTGGVDLPAGQHEVRTDVSTSFLVQDLWLTRSGTAAPAATQRQVSVRQWDVTHRRLEVGAGPAAVLRVPENASDGWVATVDGRALERTRVDGWQQAWLLPAGGQTVVRLDFLPDAGYRDRLLTGALAALLLVAFTMIPVRRRAVWQSGPGGRHAVAVGLIALLAVLGGMLPVVLLIGCLLLRAVWRPAPLVIASAGMVVATAAAVAGRLGGHGQDWAYGAFAQAALLACAAGVVSACVDWFGEKVPPVRGEVPGASQA